MYSFQHGIAVKGLNITTVIWIHIVGFCDHDFMKSFTFILKSNITPFMFF